MSQQLRTRPAEQSQRPTTETPTVAAEQVLELLGDEYARDVLRAVTECPRTGSEIADAADVSKPTAYRRLERLEEAGLVDTTQRLDPNGHHCKQFHAVVEGVDFEFGADGVSVSLDTDESARSGPSRRLVADD
jgi:DNA-binding transcriptional ArsR family regulator